MLDRFKAQTTFFNGVHSLFKFLACGKGDRFNNNNKIKVRVAYLLLADIIDFTPM